MKYLIILLLFITIIPLSSAAMVQDYLDDSGDLLEVITINKTVNSINLPENAKNIDVKGTEFSVNNSRVDLGSCDNGCEISYTIKNIVTKESDGQSFSRNLKPFAPLQYQIQIPIGRIIDLSGDNIVPKPEQITSDGEHIIIQWNINHTETLRYYVKYTNHESTESIAEELRNEIGEWLVIVFIIISLIVGFILGYKTKKDKEVSVVAEQLLSPDEKELLNEINKHYESEDKEITQKDLGKKLNWSKSKVSGVMTLLVQKKLVEKEKQGRNYRVKPITKIN